MSGTGSVDTPESSRSSAAKASVVQRPVGGTAPEALADRLEGAALVGEALANAHLTGRFHELIRLFEFAFAENGNRLVLHVAEFLSAWPLFAYSKTEVKRWLIRLRNPATHVDRAGRSGIVVEVDLRSVIGRMTMAAYDVLLNKRSWGDRSVDRRDVWRPDTESQGRTAIRCSFVSTRRRLRWRRRSWTVSRRFP